MKYTWKKLGDIAQIGSGGTPSRSINEYWLNGDIYWVKISDFCGKFINKSEEKITASGLSNSSAKIFEKGTILYTIFATIGEVSILNIPAATNQAIAGIKLDHSQANIDYVYYWLKSIKKEVSKESRGVAQNNINLSILKSLEVPLPAIEIQKKIAVTLEKAHTLIDKRKQAIAKLDELVQAVFMEMFGDPVTNTKGWELIQFKQAGSLDRGRSKHRPRNAPELLGGEYPLIQTGDVAKANIYITEYEQTYSELGLAQSKMWRRGTLCITIAANIAKTGILSFDACFPDSVVGFLPNESTNVHYVQCWLSFLQKILEERAPESAQKNINLAILGELNMPLPPIDLQEKFAEIIDEIYNKRKFLIKSLQQLESNFQALLQKAFKGELTVKDGVMV